MGDRTRFRFGVFEIDFSTGELRRKGMRVRLQKRPAELLRELLRNPDRVVSREALSRALWPDGVFVDFDHGLNVAASKLRTVLGDTASAPRYFEVVRGQGYRFIAPMESSDVVSIEIPRVAVSTFSLPGGDAEAAEFRNGFQEELLTELGRIGASSLRVVGRTSIRPLEEAKASITGIGRELDVNFVIEGSVRAGSSTWRINVRLISVTDNAVLWSDRFELDGDRWSAELEAAEVIATHIVRRVGGVSRGSSQERHSSVVRRARELAAGRAHADMLAALAMLEDAASRSAHDSLVMSSLARHLNTVAEYGLLPPGKAYLRARAAAEKAIALNPDSAEAYAALGVVAHRFSWDWAEAERCYRRAIECNPSDVAARQAFAEFLSQMQRHADAVREVREARRLDPRSAVVNAVEAWILFHAGRYDEALTTAEVAIVHDSRSPLALFVLGRVLLRLGRVESAVDAMQKAVDASGESPYAVSGLAVALAHSGRAGRAAALLSELEAATSVAVSSYLIAKVYCALGNLDRAFERMWKGVEERTGWLVDLNVDPEIAEMRKDPRFPALRDRVFAAR